MVGRMEGRVAFVTGAARGQGRAHAVRLAQEGADIIAVDVCEQNDAVGPPMATPEDLVETVRLVEKLDRRIIATRTDVRDFAAMQKAVDDGVAELGRLDAIIANAGIGATGGLLHEMGEHTWQDTIDVNLTGVFITARVAVPHIIAGGRGGSVVLTSSVAGVTSRRAVGHYAAAKHGVLGIMRTLAIELGEHSIRVNAILPTQVNTPMALNDWVFKQFRPDLENPGPEDFAPFSQQTHLLPVPWIEPEDIADAALFLVSDASRYITGVPLPIDAGALLK